MFSLKRLVLPFLLLSPGLGFADQLPSALLDSIYPPSATRGGKIDLAVKGKFLEGADLLQFSNPSLKAFPKKDDAGEVVPNVFEVEIPGDLAIGRYSVSVGGGKFGLSNEKSFIVNDLPEISLGEVADSMDSAKEIKLGHTVVGYTKASRYGWVRLSLKPGQTVVVESEDHHTDSRFSPCLAVFDGEGRKLASSTRTGFLVFTPKADGEYFIRLHDFLFKGGEDYLFRVTVSVRPRIRFVNPPLVRIGGVQKVVVFGWNLPGGLPAGIDLPGQPPLERIEASLSLASEKEIVDPIQSRDPLESTQRHHDFRVSSPAGASLPFSLAVSPQEWTMEKPDSEETVQLTPPCEFVGSFFPARDRDRFRFEAKKGDTFLMEIHCERLGFSSHAYLLVEQVTTKDDGTETRRTIAQSSKTDHPSTSSFLYLSSRDPSLRFTAPADGTFEVLAYDMFSLGVDPFKSYRFSVREESPDFALLAHPLLPPPVSNNQSPLFARSPTLRAGESMPIRVAADRRDGFEGEIKLALKGLPEGVAYSPSAIAEGLDSVVVVLTTDEFKGDRPWSGKYSITGTSEVGSREVTRACRIAKLCWSHYDNQSKITQSKLRMSAEGNLAILPGRKAPLDLMVNWKKMSEQNAELVEKTEKAIKSLNESEAKALKAREASEESHAKSSKSMKDFLVQKEEKEKRVKLLTGTEIPKSKEALKLAEAELKKAQTKKTEKDLPPETLAATEQSLGKANDRLAKTKAEASRLAAEEAQLAKELKSTFSAAELKKRQQELAKSEADLAKNSFSWKKERAKLAHRTKVLQRAKAKASELAAKMKDPGKELLVLETTLGGALTLPVSMEARDESFATPTKVRVMGSTAADKIKEITIDPKKKKEGDLAINLAQAKFSAGEFHLVCLARGKGKYKLYDELEKNATEKKAKEVSDLLAAVKKEADEAKKKADAGKKDLAAKEAELKKSVAALATLDKEKLKLATDLKKGEEVLSKAREALKKEESAESADEVKVQSLRKAVGEAEMKAMALREKGGLFSKDKLEPAKAAGDRLAKSVEDLGRQVARAEAGQAELAGRVKSLEEKKKKTDARLKVVKDDFAKPKDTNLAHFDLPFVLRVKKAPFIFEELPVLELKPGEASLLPVQVDRDDDFEDPITLKLILPKELKGVTLQSQNIEKSECLGEIKLTSQAEATEGKHTCTLEASFRYKNQNLKLSRSFDLTVLPSPKKPS